MKHFIWVLFAFAFITSATAQDVYTSSGKPGYQKKVQKKKRGYDPDKVIVGGGLSLQIGDGYTALGLSPILGYRFTDHLSAGVGIGYLYSKFAVANDPNNPNSLLYVSDNIVYPNLWARYFVYRNIFISGTFEYDFITQKEPAIDQNTGYVYTAKSSFTNQCLWLGVGLRQPLGGRVFFYGELIYDVLQGENSPYQKNTPDLRFGIAAGL